jgi:leukotriene-A4 hydrolase
MWHRDCPFTICAERQLGGLDIFLKYAQDYVKTFVGKSIGTAEWKAHLYQYFTNNGGADKVAILDAVNWDVRPFSSLTVRH